MLLTSSRAASSRPRRRRRSFGLRYLEVAIVLLAGTGAAVFLINQAKDLPSHSGTTSCLVSQFAAERASLAYFAGPGHASLWPTSFADMSQAEPPILALSQGVEPMSPRVLRGSGWTLTMTGGGTAQPSFTCS